MSRSTSSTFCAPSPPPSPRDVGDPAAIPTAATPGAPTSGAPTSGAITPGAPASGAAAPVAVTPAAPVARRAPGGGAAIARSKLLWPLVALSALLIFNWLFTPGFLSITVRDGKLFGSLVDVLNRAAPAALAGIGMTLVIATGGVDLSVGAVMAIAGSVAALLATQPHPLSPPLVLAATLAVSLACGLWNGLLVSLFRVQPIVATLLLMVAGRGIAQLLTEGQIVTFRHAALEFIGGGYFGGLPFAVTIVLIALLATAALTRLTALGLFVECVGDNETASRVAGINDRFVKLAVYAFCGLCAGVAGLIVAGNIRAADANNAGLYLELDAILAVVIGGTALTGGRFHLVGTIVGALIIQTLTTTILTRGVPVQLTLVVKAIVVLGVCFLQAPRVQRAAANVCASLRRRRGDLGRDRGGAA